MNQLEKTPSKIQQIIKEHMSFLKYCESVRRGGRLSKIYAKGIVNQMAEKYGYENYHGIWCKKEMTEIPVTAYRTEKMFAIPIENILAIDNNINQNG